MPTVVNGTTGLTFSDGSVQNTAAINFRNRIINGAMAIAQRGTSVAINGSTPTYFVDRFAGLYSTTVTGTLSQQSTGGLAGFPNCARAQRTSGQTATGNLSVIQILESANSVDLAGNSVTLSFWARAGSNFSASGSSLGVAFYTGTGTDQSAASFMAGSWTGLTAVANTSRTLTTSWQRFTVTGTASSSANQFGVLFQAGLTGTAGANDFFEITGVQLEEGTTASSFDFRSIGQELALCQRYFYTFGAFNFGTNAFYNGYYGGSTALLNVRYPVQMRATPTATVSQPTQVQYYSQGGVWTNTTITIQSYNAGGPNYNTGTTDISIGVSSDSTGGGKLLYLAGGASTTLPTVSVSAEL